MAGSGSWARVTWRDWQDLDTIVGHLEAGADPDAWGPHGGRPLHRAVQFGTPEVVSELARRVTDVDAPESGTTALWHAVVANRPEVARALVAAGADPWRAQCGGWSAGRLALAGPTPELFPRPEGEPGLSASEESAVREARRLIAALGDLDAEGMGLACVAGIDAEEARRRLSASPVAGDRLDEAEGDPEAHGLSCDFSHDSYDDAIVGLTTVPGGCVVAQPWGYEPQRLEVQALLSAGTVSYGFYGNPKSGDQGSVVRDGVVEGSDLHPGGGPYDDDTPEEVLAAYLYHHQPVAYACAYAGLRLTDARAIVGPPEMWVELPRI
ncbi:MULTISPECIES: ankyrin repeat domain-containing protein [unclassified Streptomyces]|uniref:ankyrin repeat domain-containing protein n=1 Tax=unclassified Streptomyces TaxID=2593676 RepID=UPI00278C103E|nr:MULTISPECIES: ankyrin repeat domain-containing protein [unclassified Streptomyces]